MEVDQNNSGAGRTHATGAGANSPIGGPHNKSALEYRRWQDYSRAPYSQSQDREFPLLADRADCPEPRRAPESPAAVPMTWEVHRTKSVSRPPNDDRTQVKSTKNETLPDVRLEAEDHLPCLPGLLHVKDRSHSLANSRSDAHSHSASGSPPKSCCLFREQNKNEQPPTDTADRPALIRPSLNNSPKSAHTSPPPLFGSRHVSPLAGVSPPALGRPRLSDLYSPSDTLEKVSSLSSNGSTGTAPLDTSPSAITMEMSRGMSGASSSKSAASVSEDKRPHVESRPSHGSYTSQSSHTPSTGGSRRGSNHDINDGVPDQEEAGGSGEPYKKRRTRVLMTSGQQLRLYHLWKQVSGSFTRRDHSHRQS